MVPPIPNLSLKSILITGCSSGIGKCLALGLHERGYRVIATCRKRADATALSELGLQTEILDLDDSESINTALDRIFERSQGKLYALINNGAYGQPGAVEDLTRETLRQQFETNVFGTQELTNRVIPIMRKQNHGRIIQISSVLGIVCLKYRGAYNASKYALEALTDTMRLELANTEIKFSLIEPGPIESAFRENAYRKYLQNIDPSQSFYKHRYSAVEQRLLSNEPIKYSLAPDAVLKKAIHALEHANPKVRYRVTVPTHVLAKLKRILSDKSLDKLLVSR